MSPAPLEQSSHREEDRRQIEASLYTPPPTPIASWQGRQIEKEHIVHIAEYDFGGWEFDHRFFDQICFCDQKIERLIQS